MSRQNAQNGAVSIVAYRGDAKTLLAFDLATEASRHNLAGFTVQIKPPGLQPYYLFNDLQFETPGNHAQVPTEPPQSSINAPIHKFRWVHVPGVVHQGLKPAFGQYAYTVTPRYFDDRRSMRPLDPSLSTTVQIDVAPFVKGNLSLGFTRGFVQSQAFVRHFGAKALIQPMDAPLQFDTSAISGTNAEGESFTFRQQYGWLGFTARDCIFNVLEDVQANAQLSIDVFCYDLKEPDLIGLLLKIGKDGRARIILDNAALHHNVQKPTPEDQFEVLFSQQAGASRIKRGHFGRYSHDKVIIVSQAGKPTKVLTGSTNFSVTGMYVNSNHVLVFDDGAVSQQYSDVFNQAWQGNVHAPAFLASPLSQQVFSFANANLSNTDIAFSPHDEAFARQVLGGIVTRVQQEADAVDGKGSVLFAVMELDGGPDNPVYDALTALHESQSVFSYGISDNPSGIFLYPIGSATGVLVTGKPVNTQLPKPFSQVPNIGGVGHQIHHKFVVCGFNGADPVVYCGSSNLALGGEKANGDNLLAIHDSDVATAFAIEAVALVDHFNFLDSVAKGPKAKVPPQPDADKTQAAISAGWFLGTDDSWVHKYFDPNDLHFKDRELFVS
ncbi:phospholipase D-like domain-containing protein [Mesorhizobium sp. URHB0026]